MDAVDRYSELVQNLFPSLSSIVFGRFDDGSEQPQGLFWIFSQNRRDQASEVFINLGISMSNTRDDLGESGIPLNLLQHVISIQFGKPHFVDRSFLNSLGNDLIQLLKDFVVARNL